MPQFTYTAMDASGKEQKGKTTAASEDAVAAELKSKGMFPTMIKQVGGAKNVKKTGSKKKKSALNMTIGAVKIKRKDLTVVTRQLAILLSAGLPLIRSLRTLEKQSMGFQMSAWDKKLLKYGRLFEKNMMDLTVNISLEDALDLGWKILADCFDRNEVGIKTDLVDQYWPEAKK